MEVRNTKIAILIFGCLLFALVFGDAYHPISGIQLIPLSITGIIAGLIFESVRLTDKWIDVLLTVLGGLILSFLFSIPGESYNFTKHLQTWPYLFILFFSVIALFFHGKRLIPKLTEGITLIQSIAVIYWLADLGIIHSQHIAVKVCLIIGISFSIYSGIHALTYVKLSINHRFILSLWSSIIMLLFGIDNLIGMSQSDSVENGSDNWEKVYTWLAYFLLGISSIYMIKNLLMLAGFLPSKGKFFNRDYFRSVKKLKAQHIERYSEEQVKSMHSIICIVSAGCLFALNYYYTFFPSHTAIWLVFFLVPFVLEISRNVKIKKKKDD